jgi:cysteine synthase A
MPEHQRGFDLFDTIGRTPLVHLKRITPEGGARIAVKLEAVNPSGSLKDRIYREMIEQAEKRGDLRSGMTILECSTGNAGIACSFVGGRKGYEVIIVMPRGMSEERKKLIRAYGATIVETPGGESDVDLALEKLTEIKRAEPGRYWEPAQFSNPDNIAAHFKGTGPEIWEQTAGAVDAFVASQGTGGTLTGVGRYLKERKPGVRLFAVEPAECPLLSRRVWGSHKIEGIGDGFVPRNLDLALLDGIVTTTSDEAIEMARRLAREEGIFCGISSGCNVAAAVKIARKLPETRTIVTMINDTGQRYFSTALCGEEKLLDVPERDHPMDAYTKEQLDKHQPRWVLID